MYHVLFVSSFQNSFSQTESSEESAALHLYRSAAGTLRGFAQCGAFSLGMEVGSTEGFTVLAPDIKPGEKCRLPSAPRYTDHGYGFGRAIYIICLCLIPCCVGAGGGRPPFEISVDLSAGVLRRIGVCFTFPLPDCGVSAAALPQCHFTSPCW